MEPPKSYKKVQKLTGCLAALNRFISKSGERNLPFFKTLRRMSQEKFTWDEERLLTTWAVELSEFELSYIPRISVKAQVLADFVIESTPRAYPQAPMRQIEEITDPKDFKWSLHVDGHETTKDRGQGIEFRHIPREENEEADRLSRLAITYYSELLEGVYVEMCN
ncbi:hypothetical protein LIER_04656 [Lithospermum erythrorhizon]|uniref:Uncharacterized protein n=1 Tax=Lithospermum erythrorhizon TaxID=34254 RepID=A0AAV3P283_LITER